jgi:hypothetical protein
VAATKQPVERPSVLSSRDSGLAVAVDQSAIGQQVWGTSDAAVDPRSYLMYGFRVRSDIRLPLPPLSWEEEGEPSLVFHRALPHARPPEPDGPVIASMPCDVHGVDQEVRRGPGGAWIWVRDVGTLHVLPSLGQVDVYADENADDRAVGLMLAGQIMIFILHRLGVATFHASAVLTEAGAVAFLGSSGQGKSTMAAAFLRRGATLLTDDVLVIEEQLGRICAAPGLPLMKVWQPTANCTLELSESLPDITSYSPKKLLMLEGRYPIATTGAPIRSLYLLDRYDPSERGRSDIGVVDVTGREALTGLIGNISYGAYLLPQEAAAFLPLYARLAKQATIRRLSYPDGFEHHDAVCSAITQGQPALNGAQA